MNRQAVLKHGESVQQYRGEFGFIFITLLRSRNAEKRAKFVCDVDGKYGKNSGFPYWSQILSDTGLKG